MAFGFVAYPGTQVFYVLSRDWRDAFAVARSVSPHCTPAGVGVSLPGVKAHPTCGGLEAGLEG